MFEVVGSDIEHLSDAELRSLVVRLAASELRRQGLPLASVTAGGHQDAADGGLDVRVDCPAALPRADFVPRRHTGFQVKKPDMAAAAIREEMSPKGALRPVIADLAVQQGAYIIVSAQGSIADKPLRARRKAMRDQLGDLAKPDDLHTDFYDRERVAAWVNEYPGVAAWVRTCANRPLEGWSSVDRWGSVHGKEPFLTDASTLLVDESRKPGEALEVLEGVERLRSELRRPSRCVRLIGLSGLGKTRLVQALFENEVGRDPLDPGLAIYTDYSTETRPTARDMARELIGRGEPAILIVDNCNPETHSELAKLCSGSGSPVSLLTVEYDVREDEPEHTDVFRLQAASSDLLQKWLEQTFHYISQVDRRTIAEFSHGNFRVARALAETLKRGETLGQVKSRDLFERIFRQRNIDDKSLLMAAEDLALAYSVDGDDIQTEGELARLAAVRGVEVGQFYEAIAEMRRRDVAQARGRWRAILPQAIANGLATNALVRVHPDSLDSLMRSASPRLRISISRRLGNLHDSPEARAAAARWLVPGGALGDLFHVGGEGLQIVTNLAPLAPVDVLNRIVTEVDAHPDITSKVSNHRWHWIRLIRALGYDQDHFVTAAMLLARFIAAEPEGNRSNSAREEFAEMFHLRLSGTQAPPKMRRDLIEALLDSSSSALQACGLAALEAMLKTSYFSSTASFDFGSRSRSWGWEPKLNRDVWDWYTEAIRLCVKAADRFVDARRILTGSVRGLWDYRACHDALEDAADAIVQKGPWIEGWIALRAALRFDGEQMPPEYRERLETLIDRLKPTELLHRARAAVLYRGADGWDISDGEADEGKGMHHWEKAALMAKEVGRELARDPEAREAFMAQLMVADSPGRAFECGMGLAEGAAQLGSIWTLLLSDFDKANVERRNATVLGGYLKRSHDLDMAFAQSALEDAMNRSSLVQDFPYLQARVGIDDVGIERLRRVIATKSIEAQGFQSLANGVVEQAPPESLARLLAEVSSLPRGNSVALEILHMYFFANQSTPATVPEPLLEPGRQMLSQLDPAQASGHRSHGLARVIKICCAGSGKATDAGVAIARALRSSLEAGDIHFSDINEVMKSLCQVQPQVVLDTFVLASPGDDLRWRWDWDGRKGLSYKSMGAAAIQSWASIDPQVRYGLLGPRMSLFGRGDFGESTRLDPLFQNLLRHAPNKTAFLGRFDGQVHPLQVSGSRKEMLERRRDELIRLAIDMPGEISDWVNQGLPHLDRWITSAADMDRNEEESFE